MLAVVVGVAQLVGGTGSDPQPSAAADQAAAAAARTTPSADLTYGPLTAVKVKPRKAAKVAPAKPSGPCAPRDISAVPVLDEPEAGGRVDIGVELTGTQPACTFEVSAKSLVLKIVDDRDRDFWLSAQCEGVVPKEEVVVRSGGEPTVVQVRWSSRSSDRGCGDYSRWAMPGFYDAFASVQGSLPSQTRFELLKPSVTYRTETPSPTATPKKKASASPSASPSGSPSAG